MSTWVEKLSARGYKITPQRRIILEILGNSDRHLTAEEIGLQVKEIEPSISLATVYRNLNLLVELQMVSRLNIHDGPVRYELHGGHNHHLVCMNCGAAVKLGVCPMQGEVKRIVDETGFEVSSHHFEILGYCRECSLKKELSPTSAGAKGGTGVDQE
ncbi:MAG: Fur family transcriptional regulator [Syntrophomonadaceae bacterium]|jgi:Fur family ferric uptake transcriptional regulator|nr:transcriptional repressor [Bacillota bacterium]NLP25425.1 transcriptional repressor [Syntrophomonadaceae bacterium]